jgi:hypothetical protein
MIDYKKISKSIQNNKFKINMGDSQCSYYEPYRKCLKFNPLYCFGDCKYCKHPSKCIWNLELIKIRELKARKFKELEDLKQTYSLMCKDNVTYLNYTPRDCRFDIKLLKSELKVLYEKEDMIETLPGGKLL